MAAQRKKRTDKTKNAWLPRDARGSEGRLGCQKDARMQFPLRILRQTSLMVFENFNSARDIGSPQGHVEASPSCPLVHTRSVSQLLRREVANAITMFPVWMWGYFLLFHTELRDSEHFQWGFCIFLGTSGHLPASVAYHIACLKSILVNGGFDTTWFRCLDQTMIHVYAFFATCALAHSWFYGFTVGLTWNAYAIYLLWTRTGEARHLRMVRKMVSVTLYLTPVALRGHWMLWFKCWFVFVSFSLFFVFDEIAFNGWGHSIMHCWLTPYVHMLTMASIT